MLRIRIASSAVIGIAWATGLMYTPHAVRAEPGSTPVYPQTRKCDQIDDYHGVKVADPYRWLEDVDSAETAAWVEAQNRITFEFLDKIPARDRINKRLTDLWNYEKYGLPEKHGDRYFFLKNDGLQNQNVLYWMKSLDGEPRVLLDPNILSEDGTVHLRDYAISDDGGLLAYGLSASGSDWMEWRVREVATGRDLGDLIKWVKFSTASWTKDGKGFYYGRYDEPDKEGMLADSNYFQKLYYHRIGTPQSADDLVYERKDHKDWMFTATVTDDGRYLVITVEHGSDERYLILYKDLRVKDSPVVELIGKFEARYDFIDNDGPILWFTTDLDAPRGRVIAIDTLRPGREQWKEVIPETKDTLRTVSRVGDMLIASYLADARSRVRLHRLDGGFVREIALPGLGTARGFGGKRGDPETFYQFTSYTTPTTIYRYDVASGKSTLFRKPKVAFNTDDYTSEQVFYDSKDGTRVPMFINYKKGIARDGTNPAYLYGYGGFNIALTPRFSVKNLVWMEMGGIHAVPNLRGGGEYGKEWHEAGTKANKQNVFDDFIAAAQWLIANKYTSPRKLAIGGASNGGLLVGACMTQRPDLFGACLPAVGVMDMLRFHKFTIGWAWVSDYGSSDDPEEFKALYAYSPLHNLKEGTAYPATLITTADHDDRVVPGHSFKFAAALQAAQSGPAPVLIRIQTKAGHGAGKPTRVRIAEEADRMAFLVDVLGMQVE